MSKKIIRLVISVFLPIILSIIVMFLGALVISKTEIGEGVIPFVSVVSTALLSALMSYLLSEFYEIKNIFCVFIAVLILVALKIILTLVTKNSIVLSMGNLIDVIFVVVFSFVGALLCSNSKK